MSNESLSTTSSTAYYAAVIKDLRAKRDELDRLIVGLEKMISRTSPASMSPYAPPAASPSPTGIGEACVHVLRRATAPMTTREVMEGVLADGFQINSDNPVNNIN